MAGGGIPLPPCHQKLLSISIRVIGDAKTHILRCEKLLKSANYSFAENPDFMVKLKAAMKRGSNQYLQMGLDTDSATLDEKKIREAAKFDGYYAVVTDRMELTTEEVMVIYRGQWKIEESFRVLKTDLQARPVFVWTDEHINGHIAMCYLSLCIIRYLQYMMKENGWEVVLSAEEVMKVISQPLAVVQGQFPKNIVTPTAVPQSYLDIVSMLKLPPLLTNMSLTRFRSATKLDLKENTF